MACQMYANKVGMMHESKGQRIGKAPSLHLFHGIQQFHLVCTFKIWCLFLLWSEYSEKSLGTVVILSLVCIGYLY